MSKLRTPSQHQSCSLIPIKEGISSFMLSKILFTFTFRTHVVLIATIIYQSSYLLPFFFLFSTILPQGCHKPLNDVC